MTVMIDLLAEVMDRADLEFPPSGRCHGVAERHDCDGCGVATPDVNLFATDSETGEELWLCQACGDW
jgi:hypothetical protein